METSVNGGLQWCCLPNVYVTEQSLSQRNVGLMLLF